MGKIMDALLDWMNSAAVPNLFGSPVSWIEVIGFVTGAACVYGVARQKLWSWPVGIVNNLAFMILFLGAGLYGDTVLQVIFGVVGAYGWFNWMRGNRNTSAKDDLPIRDASRRETVWAIGATAAATAVVGIVLAVETNSTVPWPDAFILAASLVATWGQAKKILQQWYVWIVVDVVSIPLYFVKGLTLTAILYIGFLALCVYGLVDWKRVRRLEAQEQASEGVVLV
ncbi:nicotinamide riboside transporter PnuC [Paenarthrobacter sp. JL.01a]|uniref:nicotinamide riboside transporter PnuC n=1 Tax=Paenarthrobacter sp. JL.01a TaxID=2979324 RepID=UPI0021C6BA5D|nr:nicotinamide riboside transporter PnuC [Paenarthrobacter sp. JL.01a]UXM92842.1 nicotinamide riboside transporter PnuC [Paenarthrobacter sp. JL.01a]